MGTRAYGAVLAAGLLAVTVSLAGCGEDGPALVADGKAPPAPYAGALDDPGREPTEKDGEDPAPKAMLEMSGAAGKALECDGAIYSGGPEGGYSKGDAGESPEDGLAHYFDHNGSEQPPYSFRVEARRDGRVLYSYDVKGRTKHAVVVAKDSPNRPGWGPETAAQCDPAEFTPAVTDAMGLEIWHDRDGRRVPTTKVSSNPGSDHCGWESAYFISTDSPSHGGRERLYARDPKGVLNEDMLSSPYDGDTRMPDDAKDTGYRFKDWKLWLAADKKTAYVRTPDGVEAWPTMKGGCA
ncbi:hypothetical protein G5C51_25190 [Streptomyces sp. A7024]|uniref:Lipoprotein n=1 Tax=Streptomyces coryli TaxID=1128680 RepID=A0A6G4U7M1_9ACTN|nr:hypothetical protein [Streptomyces coryli]NGN67191.1 hypothetical protein [Streptomyces coryli]